MRSRARRTWSEMVDRQWLQGSWCATVGLMGERGNGIGAHLHGRNPDHGHDHHHTSARSTLTNTRTDTHTPHEHAHRHAHPARAAPPDRPRPPPGAPAAAALARRRRPGRPDPGPSAKGLRAGGLAAGRSVSPPPCRRWPRRCRARWRCSATPSTTPPTRADRHPAGRWRSCSPGGRRTAASRTGMGERKAWRASRWRRRWRRPHRSRAGRRWSGCRTRSRCGTCGPPRGAPAASGWPATGSPSGGGRPGGAGCGRPARPHRRADFAGAARRGRQRAGPAARRPGGGAADHAGDCAGAGRHGARGGPTADGRRRPGLGGRGGTGTGRRGRGARGGRRANAPDRARAARRGGGGGGPHPDGGGRPSGGGGRRAGAWSAPSPDCRQPPSTSTTLRRRAEV